MNYLKKIKLSYFALVLSAVNLILYHYPFYEFVVGNIDLNTTNGVFLLLSLSVLALLLNALVFYIGLFLLRNVGKGLLVLFFLISSVALYFINTYGVIIDKSMIGNVLNTNYEESTSFLSLTLLAYLIFLGVLPSLILLKFDFERVKPKKFFIHISINLIILLSLAYANATNWLWIDKHSKTLGALVMPWSYVVNTCRFYYHNNQKNKEQILLPNATIMDNNKSVAVLVIGESSRKQNFSLYGYEKNTNPLLSQMDHIYSFQAESCATYTTAGLKCILEHKNSSKLYEILPNYLFRNGVEVIWRTSNWGEPTVNIDNFQKREELEQFCNTEKANYDEGLLCGLKEQILASQKDKILVVIHTSTSHGPTYFKKYPEAFRVFTPECKSVELANCSNEELINAYDNTIVYTDYILATLIQELKTLQGYNSFMMFVSDHGESLGEKNLYMHGLPVSLAPKEQLEIPFIVWHPESSKPLKDQDSFTQHHVFHSVLDFLAIKSSIYDKDMSIFED